MRRIAGQHYKLTCIQNLLRVIDPQASLAPVDQYNFDMRMKMRVDVIQRCVVLYVKATDLFPSDVKERFHTSSQMA
jgi:hypothetical protein